MQKKSNTAPRRVIDLRAATTSLPSRPGTRRQTLTGVRVGQ